MRRPRLEVADIFYRHGADWRRANAGHVSLGQLQVMTAIEQCRSAALGDHVERCEDCGHSSIAYNSCRNRHCPKCQGAAARDWLAAREADLLPVGYFHVVFTLPAEIAPLAYQNKAVVYDLLFRTAAETLLTIAADPRHLGARIGATAVLHSWGSAMTHHPHIHMIVPGGGISLDGTRWVRCKPGFLLPVRVLSRLFRRLFLTALADAHAAGRLRFLGEIAGLCRREAFAAQLAPLRRKNWFVYAKPPFSGPQAVLAYLARYTHRVAIANSPTSRLSRCRTEFYRALKQIGHCQLHSDLGTAKDYRMRRIAMVAACLMLSPAPAIGEMPGDCGPIGAANGWAVAAPAAEGLDPKQICSLGPMLEHLENADPHSVLIARHGALVFEHYFSGGDEYEPGKVIGRVDRDVNTLQDIHSITKSVTALLTGILADRGKVKNLDASVFSLLPQYATLRTAEKDRITLRDLLTMTSGLSWSETDISYGDPANSWRRYQASPDPFRFVLEQPLAATPGTVWNYNSGSVELLGLILQKLAGEDLGQLAKDTLFTPLEISDPGWGTASFGLKIRPRDLAKIGQLVLNHGAWHGQHVVSARWIETMTAPHAPLAQTFPLLPADSYGYLWWVGDVSTDHRRIAWTGGVGYGGQRLFVMPSLDMVVAVTAGAYTRQVPQGITGDAALRTAVRAANAR